MGKFFFFFKWDELHAVDDGSSDNPKSNSAKARLCQDRTYNMKTT